MRKAANFLVVAMLFIVILLVWYAIRGNSPPGSDGWYREIGALIIAYACATTSIFILWWGSGKEQRG